MSLLFLRSDSPSTANESGTTQAATTLGSTSSSVRRAPFSGSFPAQAGMASARPIESGRALGHPGTITGAGLRCAVRPARALLAMVWASTAACSSVERGGQPARLPERPAAEPIQVAVTVDDLPVHGPMPPGVTRLAIAERLLAAFAAHHLR